MILPLVFVWSCKDESNSASFTNLKSIGPDQGSLFGNTYNCNQDLSLNCYEPHCASQNPSNCPRVDLDPCDYTNMGDYAEAVVCELTKQLNGCSFQQYPEGCTVSNICVKNFIANGDMIQLIPNASPFVYCSYADCDEHICSGGLGSFAIHLYMSVAYQDAIITYARDIAKLYRPICPSGDTAHVGNTYFKSCVTRPDPPFPCSSGDGFCYDTEIRLRVEYVCCTGIIE